MLKIKHVAVCMLALAMLSAGCTNYSGNTYSGSQVRSAQTVQYGTVVSVQPVTLEEDRPAVLGTVGGGVVGGVLGNMVGGGRGKTLATIAGAALGAAGGYAGEKALTSRMVLKLRSNWKTDSSCPLFRPPISNSLRVNVSAYCAEATARRV